MHLFHLISHLIEGVAGNWALLALIITFGAFFSEDVTVVVVGVLAADGIVPIPIALISIFIGIVLGDGWLYFLGRIARTHPRLGRYVEHDFLAPFREWLEKRLVPTIFSARFIPGSRMVTFLSSGFFRARFSTFLCTVIVAAAAWTTSFFFLSYWFGSFTARWIGPVRWGIAGIFLLTLFFTGRHNLRAYRAKKKASIL